MYRVFGETVAESLRMLGIPAEFKPRNDIEVKGKKISGMGGISLKNSFLFQGTLLVEDKITELLHALRVPIEKLKPKEIDSVRERVTCIERELGRIPDREELKDVIRKAMQKRFEVEVISGELTEKEIKRHKELLPKFISHKWINKIQLPIDEQGMISGVYRCSSGTIKVNIIVNATQNAIRSTYITGDFFCEPKEAIYDLERLIKNIRWNEEKILFIIDNFFNSTLITGIEAEDVKNAFREVFLKWKWVEMGFTPGEANHIFAVNLQSVEDFLPEVFLLPYCAKDNVCGFRHKRECPACGKCTVGDAYLLSNEIGIEPITILSFEDLMDTFDKLKKRGIRDYIGSCCEAFYVKHQEEFRNSGLRGLLIDIENSTCYDLGKAKEAYLGKFESRTDLNLELIEKIVNILMKRERGNRHWVIISEK